MKVVEITNEDAAREENEEGNWDEDEKKKSQKVQLDTQVAIAEEKEERKNEDEEAGAIEEVPKKEQDKITILNTAIWKFVDFAFNQKAEAHNHEGDLNFGDLLK